MASLPTQRITPEEYLEIERQEPIRSEYYYGEMFAMAGNTREHSRIVFDLVGELRGALKGGQCEGFSADMRVKVSAAAYFYPDVVVVCGEPKFEDTGQDTLIDPTLVIEVLSKSTEAFDRGEKFRLYRGLDSVRQFVLVSTDRAQVECFSREPDGHWRFDEAIGLNASLAMPAIGHSLALSEIYYGATLAEDTA